MLILFNPFFDLPKPIYPILCSLSLSLSGFYAENIHHLLKAINRFLKIVSSHHKSNIIWSPIMLMFFSGSVKFNTLIYGIGK